MFFKKPPGLKYTDMSIWIDENAYKSDCDDGKMYEYIYLIIDMLAHKQCFFNKQHYYDDFALDTASQVYMRYRNPKQYEYKDTGQPRLDKIKSVLNYIKKTIYPRKVDFEQRNYQQQVNPHGTVLYNCGASLSQILHESVDNFRVSDFSLYLGDIVNICRAFIAKIPYKTDTVEWQNIYLSCLISFLNSITVSNKNKTKMNSATDEIDAVIEKVYSEERNDCIILYHLDASMRNYITILTSEIRHAVAKDLSYTLDTYVPSNMYINDSMHINDSMQSCTESEDEYHDS